MIDLSEARWGYRCWRPICSASEKLSFDFAYFDHFVLMNATPRIPRTAFKPSFHTNYAEEMEKLLRHIDSAVNKVKSMREIDVELWGKTLMNDHRNLAQCCVLSDEIPSARQFYHNTTRLNMLLGEMVKSNLFPSLPKKGKPPAYHTQFADGFPEAILSRDEALLVAFTKSLEPTEKPQSDNRFAWHITNAIRFHILGDSVRAKEHALHAHKLEFFRLPWKGFSHAVMGIIEGDQYLLNEGIELRIRAHATKEFKSIYFEYCEEATALARLAIRAGLRPNIRSAFISQKLLTGNERSEENSVDDLIAKLEKADKRRSDRFWFLRRFFRG